MRWVSRNCRVFTNEVSSASESPLATKYGRRMPCHISLVLSAQSFNTNSTATTSGS
jgi:hypothetical protein